MRQALEREQREERTHRLLHGLLRGGLALLSRFGGLGGAGTKEHGRRCAPRHRPHGCRRRCWHVERVDPARSREQGNDELHGDRAREVAWKPGGGGTRGGAKNRNARGMSAASAGAEIVGNIKPSSIRGVHARADKGDLAAGSPRQLDLEEEASAWTCATDEQGRVYYWNQVTNQTSWHPLSPRSESALPALGRENAELRQENAELRQRCEALKLELTEELCEAKAALVALEAKLKVEAEARARSEVEGAQLRTDHEEILATAVAEAVEVARAEAVEVALAEAAEAHAAEAHAAEAHASQLSSEAAPEWTERLPLGSTPWATMAAGLEVSRPFGPSGGFMDSARHPLDSPSPLQNASCALLSDTAAAIAPRVLRGPTLAF